MTYSKTSKNVKSKIAVGLFLGVISGSIQAASVTALQSDSFVDSLGMNVHVDNDYGPYFNLYSTWKPKLGALGVRYARTGAPGDTTTATRMNDLKNSYGIKFDVLVDTRNENGVLDINYGGWTDFDLNYINNNCLSSVYMIEGPNEYNGLTGNWVAELKTFQQGLYNKVKAKWPTMPVMAPSIWNAYDLSLMGNISGTCDYGNFHSYPYFVIPEGGADDYCIPEFLQYTPSVFPGKPIVISETGFSSASTSKTTGVGCNQHVQAKYDLRVLFWAMAKVINRTFKYEFINSFNAGTGDGESNYGLLDYNCTEKPNYWALKNAIDVLKDPGNSFTPGALNYSLSGSTANVKNMLFQNRSGRFFLVLWNAVSCWNTTNRTEITNANVPVTLTLNAAISTASRYQPVDSASPIQPLQTYANPTSIALSVPDSPLIIALTPGSGGSGAIANGTYKVIARHSGKAMDVSGFGTANGSQVHQWGYGGGNNQRWTFELQSGGNYEINPNHVAGKNLDINAGNTANGTKVQIWDDNNGNAQRFKIESAGSGYYRITPKVNLNACLDVAGNSTADGALVQEWAYGSGNNQQWQILAP